MLVKTWRASVGGGGFVVSDPFLTITFSLTPSRMWLCDARSASTRGGGVGSSVGSAFELVAAGFVMSKLVVGLMLPRRLGSIHLQHISLILLGNDLNRFALRR